MKSAAMLSAIQSTQQFAQSQPYVGKTISIVDYLKRMNQAMHADKPDQYRLPIDGSEASKNLASQYLLLYSMSGEPGDFDSYVDYQYKTAKITILLKTGSNAYIKTLVEKLQKHTQQVFGPGVTVSFGGDVAQTIALTDTMVKGKLQNIVQIALAIFVISALAFRSLTAGFIVLAPLGMAVLAIFGVMGAFHIPLNIPNALISAMAVGIGADYAIYLLYRMREEVQGGANDATAVRQTLATAGKAALFVATAVAGGYGVLALSIGYNVHMWLSLFIVLAMLVSVWTSLTLVPSLVLYVRPKFIFHSEQRRSWWQLLLLLGLVVGGLLVGARLAQAQTQSPPQAQAQNLSALAIMHKSLAATKVKDSLSQATFTLTNKDGATRVRQTTGATRLHANGIDNMRLVRFLSPADIKGTATLLLEHSGADDDMWVYLPALGKVRRLSASNKKDSFVGTDFSYGDVIGHQPQEWSHQIVREEAIDGAACYVIESTPMNDNVLKNTGYSKRVSWVRKDNFVLARADFMDVSGQPLKRIFFSNIQQVGSTGRWQPMLSEAENLQTGHRTRIQFEGFKADQNVALSLFTPKELER